MPSKQCSKCNELKPLTAFCKDSKGKDGYKAYCKDCKKAQDKSYRDNPINLDNIKHHRRNMSSQYKGRYKGKYKETITKCVTNWYDHTLGAKKAHRAVSRAVKNGDLPKVSSLSCEICGNRAHHYHHHAGYEPTHWLDVIPLCVKCHRQTHVAE
jgi:hypothetical protein